jgi:hypothetical protein
VDELSEVGPDLVARLEATFNQRLHKGIALHIRTKVLGARSDPDASSRRWPFELIQNAHDAGTRPGHEGISLSFRLTDGVLRFEHDAAPFTMDEFAALLTGGSSKDFMSTETTGRFGTGFLVTHVLSEQVEVSGILEVDGSYRAFEVDLDRPNDEGLLLQNVQDSQKSLMHTRLIENLDQEPTACFEYVVDDEKIAATGLDALEQSLPHLFATCRRLGEIRIQRGENEVVWKLATQKSASKSSFTIGTKISELRVLRHESDGAQVDWRLVRAAGGFLSRGAIVVALARDGDHWAVRKPGSLPSIFRQLPLLGAVPSFRDG